MNKHFYKLSKDQQKKILDSAYEVFTDTPYAKASTNTIVVNAGISKGKLFYYFKDKRTLFNHLVQKGIEYIKIHYIEQLKFDEKDFLKRYINVSQVKKKAYEQEPYLFNFMSYIYLHEIEQMSQSQRKIIEEYQSLARTRLKENVDKSLFRDDIDADLVMKLLVYNLDGYERELTDKFKTIEIKNENMEPYYQEFENLVSTLRKLFYK
ncbi:TetR/AcrR family transcriptional regulator [Liberiplasma polymorphum]|uniref:TetR/AcrR family transcriptional regulator n=1 Tax=Liberiplasma polymorphum TaxID=3374570 RepID=UPI003772448E